MATTWTVTTVADCVSMDRDTNAGFCLRFPGTCIMNAAANVSDQFEDDVIEYVKSNPVLYALNTKTIKFSIEKDKLWEELSDQLGKTAAECKSKWKTIRDSYRRNKIKGGTKSKYHNLKLKFLDKEWLKHGKMPMPIVDYEDYVLPSIVNCQSLEDDQQNMANDDMEVESTNSTTSRINKRFTPIQRGQGLDKIKRSHFKQLVMMHRNTQTSIRNLSTSISSESVTHAFFKSMADVVSSFSPHLIAEVRMKICNLVSEAEIRSIAEKSISDTVCRIKRENTDDD